MLSLATLFIVIATLLAVFNHLVLKLPASIGLMITSLVGSVALVAFGLLGVEAPVNFAVNIISHIDLESLIMDGMLSFLLFAGALHVDFKALYQQRGVVLALASIGVLITTFLIGGLMYVVLGLLGIELGFLYCLIFGALISPTDPIAVIGILKQAGVPKSLELKIAGESLFNDGVAVVLSLVLLGLLTTGGDLDMVHVGTLFAEEVVGGLVLGLLLGFVSYFIMKRVDDYKIEIMLTLSVVMGGYWLAQFIHASGPLAMVAAGLLIGNHGKEQGMSEHDIEYLDNFWEMIDELFNSILFVLIGLEVLVIYNQGIADLDGLANGTIMGLIAIPLVLFARFISISGVVYIFKPFRELSDNAIKIMTWGGLRGGISIALCLALPDSPERSLILVATYIVVVFSIFVQGLTVGKLVKKELE